MISKVIKILISNRIVKTIVIIIRIVSSKTINKNSFPMTNNIKKWCNSCKKTKVKWF